MPWKEDGPMELRAELIREWKEGESVTALAEAYGVSRKTIYKWLGRHESEGTAGLADRSRAPHNSPLKVSAEMIAHIIETRQHWGWGPRKLLVKMAEAWPEEKIPSASTVAEVLRGKGLSHARKRRLRTPPYAEPFADVAQCNRTWCADFKGWFRTRDGTRCDPLTITDAYSRFLLCCQIAVKADTVHVEALFDAAFREYGLPEVIHTDNGAPFASRAPGGLSRLSMRWVRPNGARTRSCKPNTCRRRSRKSSSPPAAESPRWAAFPAAARSSMKWAPPRWATTPRPAYSTSGARRGIAKTCSSPTPPPSPATPIRIRR